MKYFTSLEKNTRVNFLKENPCRLLDFALLNFSTGDQYESQAGDREILAVILGGRASFEIGDIQFKKVGGRPHVFAGKPHAVYIPSGKQFAIKADEPIEVALISAPSSLKTEPYLITPQNVTHGVWGAANFSRNYHQILTESAQPELPAQRLIVGETFTPSGNWSTYPPHKHEVEDLPGEAFHEEMYYFKVSPKDGFGLCHYYNGQGEEENFTIRDNTLMMAPHGYHTVVSAPGYTTYYLWFLAGEHRVQATADDPSLSWVGRTVPMLRNLRK